MVRTAPQASGSADRRALIGSRNPLGFVRPPEGDIKNGDVFGVKQNTKQRRVKDILTKHKCSTLSSLLPDSVFALYWEFSLSVESSKDLSRVRTPSAPHCSTMRTGSYPPPTAQKHCDALIDAEWMWPLSRAAGRQLWTPRPPVDVKRRERDTDGRLSVHRGAGPDRTDAHEVWHLAALILHSQLWKLNRKVAESHSGVRVY